MDRPLRLRAHHLLCIHGFRGMGYDDEFVVNMSEIVRRFHGEPELQIQVLNNLDAVCSACPSNGGDVCERERRDRHIQAMDGRVIEKLGLTAGGIYTRDELVRRTAAAVAPEDLDVLCQGCRWLPCGVCKEGMAALRAATGRNPDGSRS
ncbi:MAG: DUF1284 domain-containing protein [Kyrpidia sp.]|nr:DUF1284 domain-containing protein [Kyrpidia sp.]